MKTLYWLPVLLLIFQSVTAQSIVYESGGVLSPEQAAYKVHFYDLNLKVNPADSTVYGSVEVHFDMVHPSNVLELALDPRLEIEKIEWAGRDSERLRFTHEQGYKNLMVYFPETLQAGVKSGIRVTYGGKPRVANNPPWGGGMVWSETPSGKPWIGVATQTNGAWIWWPNKDHPSDKADSVAINLTMPDDLIVASNGRSRGETDHGDGWKTWHWFVSTPINNYNVTLNAAPYEIIKDTYTSTAGDELDVIFWVLPEYREQGEWLFPQFAEQMRFLEEILGPYPFRADKYGVAHAPYLGMEHQTLIAYGANFENDNLFGQNAGFDDLMQHELAHEWWGNMVTVWDWRDFWIHEGIGTYMQPLYAEHLGGKESYNEMMELFRTRISSQSEVAPRRPMTTLKITGGGRGGDVYYKGAWFMHTLRYVIGDENFFKVLRRFAYPDPLLENTTDGSPIRFATTDDLMHLAEELTGTELGWLFEIYLRQPELPKLTASRKSGRVILQWHLPEGHAFPMPIEVSLDGEVMTLIPENNQISFEVDDHVEVEVDPNHWILKEFEMMD
jgi:aminopeptidase N